MNIESAEIIREKLDNVIKAAEGFNTQSAQLETVRNDFQHYLTSVESVDTALKEFVQKCNDYIDSTQSIISDDFSASTRAALSEAEQILASCKKENEDLTDHYKDAVSAFDKRMEETVDRENKVIAAVSENTERVVSSFQKFRKR